MHSAYLIITMGVLCVWIDYDLNKVTVGRETKTYYVDRVLRHDSLTAANRPTQHEFG